MFRRAFWFTTGAAAGVWATTKVQRKLRSLTPESVAVRTADRAVLAGQRLRDFALDVRTGMAQREGELQDALGIGELPHAPAEERERVIPPQTGRPGLGPVPRTTRKEDH